jgi:histidinol phosphatase-like PHP family hydrolase
VARHAGVRIAINTDAHHPHQLDFVSPGLASALAAKIPAERIVNSMPTDDLLAWLQRRWRVQSIRETAYNTSG